MNKFLFYCADFDENTAIIVEEDFRHATKVLRYGIGADIQCTDGQGNHFIGKIQEINKKELKLIIETKNFTPPREKQLHIAIAPTKNMSRIETMIEKCVEIGVDEISFLKTKNSERKVIKLDRVHKIALSAMKQSFRTRIPVLNEMTSYPQFLDHASTNVFDHASANVCKYLLNYKPDASHLLDSKWVDKNLVLVGPEGDFTCEEIENAEKAGFETRILGNAKLRTETAGIVACSIFNVINRQ